MAQEVAQLQGLLDLFEEDLDLPTAAVEVCDGGRRPFEIIGEKLHLSLLAVELNQGGDAAKPVGVLAPGMISKENDFVVTQYAAFGLGDPPFNHA